MKRFIVGLMWFMLFSLVWSKDFIPPKAYLHRDTIQAELDRLFPDIPKYNYIPALIEHESCLSLTHSRCWTSTSQLKSKRELGVGLGQVTKAFNEDGTIRFDTLLEMRNKYRLELNGVNWDNIYQRPDAQIRIIVLMTRDNYKKLYDVDDPFQRLAMSDVAYNGGFGCLQKERRQCSLTKGCNASIWFGHVEKYCLKSKKILYGNRSACDISRNHPIDILLTRTPKYERMGYFTN